mgnify:CR=1 FL=1
MINARLIIRRTQPRVSACLTISTARNQLQLWRLVEIQSVKSAKLITYLMKNKDYASTMIPIVNQPPKEIIANCVKMVTTLIHNRKSAHKILTSVPQLLREDIARRASLALLSTKIGNASKLERSRPARGVQYKSQTNAKSANRNTI